MFLWNILGILDKIQIEQELFIFDDEEHEL
jgi:hypothetical protein